MIMKTVLIVVLAVIAIRIALYLAIKFVHFVEKNLL